MTTLVRSCIAVCLAVLILDGGLIATHGMTTPAFITSVLAFVSISCGLFTLRRRGIR